MNKIFTTTALLLLFLAGSLFAQDKFNYLTFEKAGNKSISITFTNVGENAPTIYYSTDGEDWTLIDKTKKTTKIECDNILYVKGDNPNGFSLSTTQYTTIKTTNPTKVSGSVMSLIDGKGEETTIPREYCFYSLFSGSKSLQNVPELNATILKKGCYANMFASCTNIQSTPVLPAETLEDECYQSMFSGCTKLSDVKPLIAKELKANCYKEMFKGCTIVNSLIINFIIEGDEPATTDWLAGAATKGTIICFHDLDPTTANSFIPDNWSLVKPNYLKITAEEDNVDIILNSEGTAKCNIEYSFDGLNFETYTAGEAINLPKQGDYVFLSGNNPTKFSSSSSNYHHFNITKTASVSGSVMSLLDRYGITEQIPNTNCFYNLFAECYITTPPLLPATDLKDNCYNSMFQGCTSLIQSPELNATTLAKSCYNSMFQGCTSLINAPELKATSTIAGCYNNMFEGCSSLKNLKISFTSWTDENEKTFTTLWLKDVSEVGTIYCPIELELSSRGQSKIPSKWLVNPHKVYIKDGETEYFDIENESIHSFKDNVTIKLTNTVPSQTGYDKGVSVKMKSDQTNIEVIKKTTGFSFEMPNDDVEISVIYIPKEYSISTDEYINCEIATATVESEPIPFTVTDRTKEGYNLSSVKIGKDVISETYTGSFKMSDYAKDVTITANYTLIKYTVTKDDNITNLSKTKPTFKDTVRFKIKDLTLKGYAFKHILVNGTPKVSENFYDSVMMVNYMSDIKLSAVYEPITFTITTGEHITCNINTATVESDPITFTVADRTAEGYSLTKVAIGTKTIPVENYAGTFNMSDFAKDVTITATYTPIKYQITKDENISCRKTTATVEDDISFTIKNLTSTGWQLKKVFVNAQEIDFQDYSATFKMKDYISDVNITAEYKPITFTITTGEYISCNIKTATVESDPITFTVADHTTEGYSLTKVAIGTKTIPVENNIGTFNMSDFAKDVTITATYTPIKYQITKDENISCRKTTATVEDEISFTIKNLTSSGWQLKKVLVNAQEIAFQDYSATIKMKDYISDVNITAEYEPITFTITTGEYISCNIKTATVESEPITFTVADRTSEGYSLTKVAIGTKTITVENNIGTFNMSDFAKDVTITATYTPIKYTITKDGNITCRKTTATVEDEISFTIKNLKSTGWQLKKVLVNAQEIAFQDYSATIKMKDYISNVNITTEYQLLDYKITTDENCRTNQEYADINSLIKITAADHTSQGYELENIFVNGSSVTFYKYFCNFMMSDYKSDVEVTTQYKPITYKVKTGKNVFCEQNSAKVDDVLTFTVDDLSEDEKLLEKVLVNGKQVEIENFTGTIKISDYISDITIEAVYTKYHTIKTDNNVVEISHTTAQKDEQIQFTINRASEGYDPLVYVNSRRLYSPDSINYSFLMFDSDVEIFVEYQEIITEEPEQYEETPPEEETIIIKKIRPTEKDKVKVYPSPAKVGEPIIISLENIDTKRFTDSKIIIFNSIGNTIITISNPQKTNKITLQPGLYRGAFVCGGHICNFNLLITK